MLVLIRKKGVEYLNTAYLDMIQGKNPGVTPVWYMRQAGRSQAEYRKIKEKYTLFEITKEPELCARVTELPVKEYGVDAAILYKDIMSPMVGMNVNVELKAGVGPVFNTPIRSMADVDTLDTFDPTKVSNVSTSAMERIGVLNTGPTPALSSTFTFIPTIGLIISL